MLLYRKTFPVRFFIAILAALLPLVSIGQDSTLYKWDVSSTRKSDSTYELVFKTPGNAEWQLYGANEMVADVAATYLELDSSVRV
jgi:hypothetical protein